MFGPLEASMRSPDLLPIRFDPASAPWRSGGLLPAGTDSSAAGQQPQERTAELYRDRSGQVGAGLWEVRGGATNRSLLADRELFLLLLPASSAGATLTLTPDAGGDPVGVERGQGVILPRGGRHSWRQPPGSTLVLAYLYFADDAAPSEPAGPAVACTGAEAAPPVDTARSDTSRYIPPVPRQHMRLLFTDPSQQFLSVLWDTTTMHTRPLPHPGNPPCPNGQIELAFLTAGACTIVNGDGVPSDFVAGEAYLVPRGMTYSWHSEGFTRKIAANFRPRLTSTGT